MPGTSGAAKPCGARGAARVEVRAHHVERSARHVHRRHQRDAPLQHERQLEGAGFGEGEIREDRIAAVARPAPFRMDGTYRRLSRSSRAISTMSARGTVRGGKRAGGPPRTPRLAGMDASARNASWRSTMTGASTRSRTRPMTSASLPRPIHRFQLTIATREGGASTGTGARSSDTGVAHVRAPRLEPVLALEPTPWRHRQLGLRVGCRASRGTPGAFGSRSLAVI